MYSTITARFRGIAPMLQHSAKTVDEQHPLKIKMDELVDKKKSLRDRSKKRELDIQISRVEWEAGLHFDKKMGPYVPGPAVWRAIQEAAKTKRKGADVKRAVTVLEDFPLEYDGPRTLEKMWAAKDEDGFCQFADRRAVSVSNKRVIRTRPKFEDWSIIVQIHFNEEMMAKDTLVQLLHMAGFVGIGDFRERFGKFEVEILSK